MIVFVLRAQAYDTLEGSAKKTTRACRYNRSPSSGNAVERSAFAQSLDWPPSLPPPLPPPLPLQSRSTRRVAPLNQHIFLLNNRHERQLFLRRAICVNSCAARARLAFDFVSVCVRARAYKNVSLNARRANARAHIRFSSRYCSFYTALSIFSPRIKSSQQSSRLLEVFFLCVRSNRSHRPSRLEISAQIAVVKKKRV